MPGLGTLGGRTDCGSIQQAGQSVCAGKFITTQVVWFRPGRMMH